MKKKIFKEYENSHPIKPFDETFKDVELKDNKYKHKFIRNRVFKIVGLSLIGACAVVIIIPFVAVLSIGLRFEEHLNYQKKSFSIPEIKDMDLKEIKRLTSIEYPTLNMKDEKVTKDFVLDVNNFAYKVFNNGINQPNFGYSPISLYMHFDILSTLANDEYQPIFDDLLGGDSNSRLENIVNTFLVNFYQNDDLGTYMYNGLFLDDSINTTNYYLNELTKRYVETYQLNLQNDNHINFMKQWVNDHSPIKNITNEDLDIDDGTIFYLFSSLYFVNKWKHTYDSDNTSLKTFTNIDNTISNVEFMTHAYYGEVYEYDDYISFYDYYASHDYRVQYIFNKTANDSIFDIIKGNNFLNKDESEKSFAPIELTMPKFSFKNNINFSDILKGELPSLFDENGHVFNKAFGLDENINSFLKYTKQKNEVIFKEEGTKVKTLTFSSGAADVSDPSLPNLGYVIKLDSPFIYIIKDLNNVPIYIGVVTNL